MPSPQQEQAIQWVSIKRKRGYGTRFHLVDEDAFYDGLIERILKPNRINQQETYTCGPATFIRAIAEKRPLVYAKFACNLFAFGEAQIDDFAIKAYDAVLTARTDQMLGMAPVDWVVLGSIRTSKNFLLTDIGTMPGGATFAMNIDYWFKQAGFRSTNKTSLITAEGWSNWTEACQRCANDEMVCIWMHTNMFENSMVFSGMFPSARCANRSYYPDHWVGLTQVRSVRDPVDVDLYSWGTTGRLRYDQDEEADFIRHYYGFVSADPFLRP